MEGIVIENGWTWLNWFGGRLVIDGEASEYAIEVCGMDYENMGESEYLHRLPYANPNIFHIRDYESDEQIPAAQIPDLINRLETEPVFWRTEFGGLDEVTGLVEETKREREVRINGKKCRTLEFNPHTAAA